MIAEQMPILRPLPVKKRGERRRWELMADWEYKGRDYTENYLIKKGFIFDGASIPRLFWNVLSPTGYLFIAGLIHDHLYKFAFIWTRSTENPENIYRMPCDKSEADQIFQDVADFICMGEKFYTGIAKKALQVFGFVAWNEHRERDISSYLSAQNAPWN